MQSIISLSEGQYHSPSGEYNRGAHPYGVRLPGRCIFYSRLFPDRLRRDRRNFISRPPLGRGAEHFDILPALQPPGQRQLRADRQLRPPPAPCGPRGCRADSPHGDRAGSPQASRRRSPARAVCGDRPARGRWSRAARRGCRAPRCRASSSRPARRSRAAAPPARGCYRSGSAPSHSVSPACRGRLLQAPAARAPATCPSCRTGARPRAGKHKTGDRGFHGNSAEHRRISGQDDLIDDMFHSPTSLYSYGRVYSPARAIMKWNMVIKTACRDRGRPKCFSFSFCGACPSWTRPQDGIPACAPTDARSKAKSGRP